MTPHDPTRARDPRACAFMRDGFDFTSPDLLVEGLPIAEFAELRRTAPIWWNAQSPGTGGGFHDGGYWVISKHRHIREISRDDETFSATTNGVIMRFEDDMPAEGIEVTKELLINHDPPEHTRLRRLVSPLFTPRAVHALQGEMNRHAAEIVQKAAESGTGDFVHQVAVDLPLIAIADLLGVPGADREKLFAWSNSMMNADDPEFTVDPTTASAEVLGYAHQMAEERKRCPAEDIVSELVTADLGGESLSELEFGYFFILLSVAGNETTRNAISHGMHAFLDHPEQWEIFRRDRPRTAADEIVRWATPVNCFQRTARRDVDLGGVHIAEGERVGLFYGSANFDEDVFDDPFTFDILRDPNPHVGFGGNGTHFCIGANLARMEIMAVFSALADHCPDIARLGPPERLRHGWINGIKRLPVTYMAP